MYPASKRIKYIGISSTKDQQSCGYENTELCHSSVEDTNMEKREQRVDGTQCSAHKYLAQKYLFFPQAIFPLFFKGH
jgi:hypothetical protein